MAELQRRGLGFSDGAPAAVKRQALHGALTALAMDADRGVDLLAALHNIPIEDSDDAEAAKFRRIELLDLLSDWVVALARLQPTVFFLDDLHWADPPTLDLLERLVDRVAFEPLMLIVAARPDRPPVGEPTTTSPRSR